MLGMLFMQVFKIISKKESQRTFSFDSFHSVLCSILLNFAFIVPVSLIVLFGKDSLLFFPGSYSLQLDWFLNVAILELSLKDVTFPYIMFPTSQLFLICHNFIIFPFLLWILIFIVATSLPEDL